MKLITEVGLKWPIYADFVPQIFVNNMKLTVYRMLGDEIMRIIWIARKTLGVSRSV